MALAGIAFMDLQRRPLYDEGVSTSRLASALTRLFLALLVATIGVQAIPAGKLHVQSQHGSAFSAETAEMALVSRLEYGARVALPDPALPPPERLVPLAALASQAVEPVWTQLSAAFPAPRIETLPYPPRAPPRA